MYDLTKFTHDQLRKVARVAKRETNLLVDATEKFLQYDRRITVEVAEKAINLAKEAKGEAEKRGLTEIKSYQFRKEFIKNYPVS
jgi:hypothetical protein